MKSNSILFLLTACILMPALTGCDLYRQDSYTEQYVVDAWLVALEPMPEIRLSTTAPIDERFEKGERGVTDAQIIVRTGGQDGQPEQIIVYSHVENGVYQHTDGTTHIVQPRQRYRLEITAGPDAQLITAQTVVPDTFRVISKNADSLPYQGTEQFRLELSPSAIPEQPAWYIFSTRTLDTENAELTPVYAGFGDDREDFYVVSSGIINEAGTQTNGEGIVELIYPWIGVAFFGPNRITASVIDRNAYDFIRSAQTQLGGSTQSPGEIENLIYNINGGIGIFGSMAQVSVEVNVLKPSF